MQKKETLDIGFPDIYIGHIGFEPINCGFRVRCLTIWRMPINIKY